MFYHQILEDNFLRRPLSLKLNNSWSWGFHQKNLPKSTVEKSALGVQALEINRPGGLPSGKRLHNYGKSPFFMGKSTISMAIFNSFLYVYQRVCWLLHLRKQLKSSNRVAQKGSVILQVQCTKNTPAATEYDVRFRKHCWLVVDLPLWKIWVSCDDYFQYMEK